MIIQTKYCVTAVIYDTENRIFLMTSSKWNGYIVPGGKKEISETDEEALRREIREELKIELTNLEKICETIKEPSNEFYDPTLRFYFSNYLAKACSTIIVPNREVKSYGWFSVADAMQLPLAKGIR